MVGQDDLMECGGVGGALLECSVLGMGQNQAHLVRVPGGSGFSTVAQL